MAGVSIHAADMVRAPVEESVATVARVAIVASAETVARDVSARMREVAAMAVAIDTAVANAAVTRIAASAPESAAPSRILSVAKAAVEMQVAPMPPLDRKSAGRPSNPTVLPRKQSIGRSTLAQAQDQPRLARRVVRSGRIAVESDRQAANAVSHAVDGAAVVAVVVAAVVVAPEKARPL